jgi:hypothetical protein
MYVANWWPQCIKNQEPIKARVFSLSESRYFVLVDCTIKNLATLPLKWLAFSVVSMVAYHNLSSAQPLNYYICSGIDSIKFVAAVIFGKNFVREKYRIINIGFYYFLVQSIQGFYYCW